MEQKQKTPNPRKIFTIRHANFFMLLAIIGVTAYALFGPIIPADYQKPQIVDVSKVRAGNLMTYKIYTCRYVSDAVVTTVTRKLVSTTNKQLAPIILSSDTLTNDRRCLETTKTVVIPSDTPAGDYQLVVQGIYQIIPLRKPVTVTAMSDSFYLKAADPNQVIINRELQTAPITGSGSSSQQNGTSSVTPSKPNNNSTKDQDKEQQPEAKDPGIIPSLLNSLLGLKITL